MVAATDMSASTATANGTRKPSQNGSGPATRNGKSAQSSYFGHSREEVTRLLIQTLQDLDYRQAAASVCQESGYSLENLQVAAFRRAVSTGDWGEAESLLCGATIADPAAEYGGSGIVLVPNTDPNVMCFWLRQQKFLELLEARKTNSALHVLRNELTPMCQDVSRLHFLSSLLMCETADQLRVRASWDGAEGGSRLELLSRLSTCISPSVMLPEHRLPSLLHQAKSAQVAKCLYHTDASPPSLYSDHTCDKCEFPFDPVAVLDKHDGEVWQVKFSRNGKLLASCGGDKKVLIWEVPTFRLVHTLLDHEDGVGNLDWSPDDSSLVTCCQDRHARLWDTKTGALIRKLDRQAEPVSGCAWLPDGQSFIVSSFDLQNSITQYSATGQKIADWDKKHRVEDVVLSPDQRWLVAMTDRQTIHVYDFATKQEVHTLDLQARTFSISVSMDAHHLLVNTQKGDLSLYDTASWEVIQEYKTSPGDSCVIRSGFGGANESFVVSGGENGEVVIFHRTTGVIVATLPAHLPRCNSIAWNPADAKVFATCGDDKKIKIWSTKAHIAQLLRSIPSSPHRRPNGWDGGEGEV